VAILLVHLVLFGWAVEYAVARQSIAAGMVVPRGSQVRIFLVPALNSGLKHPPCNSFAPTRP
jgi:hypothetical protein